MISPSNPSLLPSPYAQAVSKKLQPSSTPSCIAAKDSLSSEPLHPLIPHNPWAMSLTSKPVRPRLRYFMKDLSINASLSNLRSFPSENPFEYDTSKSRNATHAAEDD